jgi:hypothetical protein
VCSKTMGYSDGKRLFSLVELEPFQTNGAHLSRSNFVELKTTPSFH